MYIPMQEICTLHGPCSRPGPTTRPALAFVIPALASAHQDGEIRYPHTLHDGTTVFACRPQENRRKYRNVFENIGKYTTVTRKCKKNIRTHTKVYEHNGKLIHLNIYICVFLWDL